MKKYFLYITIPIFFFLSAFTIHNYYDKLDYKPIIFPKGKDYKSEWKKVNSLEEEGLPKSALEAVRAIYEDAKKTDNIPQVIKALLYDIKIVNYSQEDGLLKAIDRIRSEIDQSKTPIKQILHSLNAELYFKYYQKNQWKLHQRPQVSLEFSDDIATWSVDNIHQKIVQEYHLSLSESNTLQRISLETIESILTNLNEGRKWNHPTLYDFIVKRAINAFVNQPLAITTPVNNFLFKDEDCWANAENFVDVNIQTEDTMSLKWNALQMLQSWIRFRMDVNNPSALLLADLNRYEMLYDMSDFHKKDELYIEALTCLENQFSKLPEVAYVKIELAEQMRQKAQDLVSSVDKKDEFNKYNNACIQKIDEIRNASVKDSVLLQKCKYLMAQIEKPSFSFITEEILLPKESFPIQIKTSNSDRVVCTVYNMSIQQKENWANLSGENLFKKIKKNKFVYTRMLDLKSINDYQVHTSDFIIDGLEMGNYAILFESISDKGGDTLVDLAYVQVSNLALLQKSNKGQVEAQVLHRKTGKPLSGVTVKVFEKDYNYRKRKHTKRLVKTVKTDKLGYVSFTSSDSKALVFELEYKGDKYDSQNRIYADRQEGRRSARKQTHLFTDRAIYRPGQTIYFKAILLEDNQNEKQILKFKDLVVDLLDANYQKVSSLNLTTNEYGSVSGNFILPQNLLNGRMTLRTKYGSQQIRVEEYKRPKFEVIIGDFKQAYCLGEDVNVRGQVKAFSGYDIADANVNYRVARVEHYSWRRYMPLPDTEIAFGAVKIDKDGRFEFDFKAVAEANAEENASYRYQIEVDVTDISGETRSTESFLNIGKKSLILDAQISDYISADNLDSIDIKALNLNGEEVDTDVKIELFEMKSGKNLKHELYWANSNSNRMSQEAWTKLLPNYQYQKEEDKQVKRLLESTFNTQGLELWSGLKNQHLKQGIYALKLTATDVFGNKVERLKTFSVMNAQTKGMPVIEKLLFLPLNNNLEPGEMAKILLGTSFKKQTLILEIDKSDGRREQRKISLNNEKKVIKIPIEDADRGGFSVHVSMVRNNRTYRNGVEIKVPHTNCKLDVTFETFRSKIYPGKKEEWKLKVRGAKGEKVAAEMLVGMYDASLDEFADHNWAFNIIKVKRPIHNYHSEGFRLSWGRTLLTYDSFVPNANFRTSDINWFGFNSYGVYLTRGRNLGRNLSKSAPMAEMGSYVEEEIPVTSQEYIPDMVENDVEMEVASDKEEIKTKKVAPKRMVLKIRKNFNETAFFYPQLKTDKEGNIIFSFTMPESLTKWNFKGLAHTKDLKYGFVNQEVITQKDMMVEPNTPRFFREGDDIYLPIKLINLKDVTIQTHTKVHFYDAITNENLNQKVIAEAYKKTLEIDAKSSKVLKVHMKIPTGISAIRYHIVSSTNSHADGEERIIPVLTNRVLVTETMPMPIRKKGSKTFKLDKLLSNKSKSLENYSYTLEMTSNPSWYAVQALPYLAESTNKSSEQVFSRLYANTLAAHIANSNPKIKVVFEAWKSEANGEAFLSNLDKNEELKNIILQESPWVRESKSESEQKQRIAALFDMNQLAYAQNINLKKLKEMQMPSGAWSWFEGMRENRYITQLIISGFGKLKHLNAIDLKKDYVLKQMLKKSVAYLDAQIVKDYQQLKKNYKGKDLNKSSYSSATQIQYLWMRSYFEDVFPIPKESNQAVNYYKGNTRTYWNKHNTYMQTMIGLASLRDKSDASKVEDKILKSLKEFAIHNDEMGMYWKDSYGLGWHQAAIEQQALSIAFFKEMGEDVEDLKVWLLKQKQTQNWKTTPATTDAIYALLLEGSDYLVNTEMVQVKVGGQDIKFDDNTKVQVGTAYYKKSWLGSDVRSKMGEVKLTKKEDGVAWGAVYWQYFEDMDKVIGHNTNLKIEKQLFIEEQTNFGEVLKSFKNKSLQVGDKLVVRMIVKTDRNLEFVHLKDMHASGLESINVLSGYRWKSGVGYYETTKDASTNFFFDYLPKGTYVFEYSLRVLHTGDFTDGIAKIQCMYAPEFSAHSNAVRLKIEE